MRARDGKVPGFAFLIEKNKNLPLMNTDNTDRKRLPKSPESPTLRRN